MSACAGSYSEPSEEAKKKKSSEIATFQKGGTLITTITQKK